MKCRDCAEGRKFSAGSVYCVMYGIIIREGHECTRKGGKPNDKAAEDPGDHRGDSTNADETGGGRRGSAETLPGVLYESGE